MDVFNRIFDFSNDYLWGYVLIIMLVGIGLYFTIRSRFVQFRMIKEMFRLLGEGARDSGEKKGFLPFRHFALVQHPE